jgi:hypothetical protein
VHGKAYAHEHALARKQYGAESGFGGHRWWYSPAVAGDVDVDDIAAAVEEREEVVSRRACGVDSWFSGNMGTSVVFGSMDEEEVAYGRRH